MKTTLAGVLTIVAGVANFLANLLQGTGIDATTITLLVGALTAGIGLIKAQDAP